MLKHKHLQVLALLSIHSRSKKSRTSGCKRPVKLSRWTNEKLNFPCVDFFMPANPVIMELYEANKFQVYCTWEYQSTVHLSDVLGRKNHSMFKDRVCILSYNALPLQLNITRGAKILITQACSD